MLRALLLIFILVPIAELGIFMALGSKLGLLPTLAIIVLTGILGAALTKSQGAKTLSKFQATLAAGKMPAKELVDGLLILVAGAVLLTPGFLTDAIGFTLLVPPARAALRGIVTAYLAKHVNISVAGMSINPETSPPEPAKTNDRIIDV